MAWDICLIAGPTASGKSALALKLAQEAKAVIINADAMQIYKGLRVITACPDEQDLAKAPHLLYNFCDPLAAYSVANWLADVSAQLTLYANRKIIIVGGTGLYFDSLLSGLAYIPPIDPSIRQKWRELLQIKGPLALYELLKQKDPTLASRLKAQDGQRIVRALEVEDMTGRPLSFWQGQKSEALLTKLCGQAKLQKYVLMPPRPLLYQHIEKRFDAMVENGAITEVVNLLKYREKQEKSHITAGAMKAIGVFEIMSYLTGKLTFAEAVILAKTRSRQYAKRQISWFKNRFASDWDIITNYDRL